MAHWTGCFGWWRLLGGYFTNSMPPQNYIRIAGEKPADVTIKAWANYIASGDDCESYSYDMFGQKAHQGGKSPLFSLKTLLKTMSIMN